MLFISFELKIFKGSLKNFKVADKNHPCKKGFMYGATHSPHNIRYVHLELVHIYLYVHKGSSSCCYD